MESPAWFDSSLPSSSLKAPRVGLALVPADEAPCGLIPITIRSFALPGGSYGFPNFHHDLSCRNAMSAKFDDAVWLMVVSTIRTTRKEVVVAVQAYLLGRGCLATRGLDKDSTTGLLVQFHSARGSVYSLSLLLSPPLADSRAVVPESSSRLPLAPTSMMGGRRVLPTPTMLGSSSLSAPCAAPPTRQSSILVFAYRSSSTPSWQKDMSSGEKALYGRKFRFDRESGEDFQLLGRRVRSTSPTKRRAPSPEPSPEPSPVPAPTLVKDTPFLRAVPTDTRRKVHIVPGFVTRPLGDVRLEVVIPRLPAPFTIEGTPSSPPYLATADVIPTSLVVIDVLIALGDGKNSDPTGLGNSVYAHDATPGTPSSPIPSLLPPRLYALPTVRYFSPRHGKRV